MGERGGGGDELEGRKDGGMNLVGKQGMGEN